MKRVLFYVLFTIIIIYTMPIIFTNQFKTKEVVSDDLQESFDYGEYNNIRLLHVQTGEVESMNLDTYLYGVVASEMPVIFEEEALKAQAVVARTYTIYQISNGEKHKGIADICDSPSCCQAWMDKENRIARWNESEREENWNKILKAVNDTKGKIVLYNGKPINALFHSNSGGLTELAINVWGGEYPYFQSVETSGEENYTSYNSEVQFSKEELKQKMKEKYSDFSIDFSKDDCIKIIEYTESNRVKKIKIGNKELSGVDTRVLLGLKSTNFSFKILDDAIVFGVIGYGHGVGLSQCGSDSLAKQGKNYEEIIKYYYKDVEISE